MIFTLYMCRYLKKIKNEEESNKNHRKIKKLENKTMKKIKIKIIKKMKNKN